jgi:hypothetical protein
MVKSITIKRLNMKNAYNKLLKRDKLQLAGSAPLHILANYNLPLNRALYYKESSCVNLLYFYLYF